MGKIALRGAVARILEPGVKFDEVVVLIGPGGIGKSSGLLALCHDPEWFTDSVPLHLETKHMIEATHGKWICEIAEMDTYGKGAMSKAKAAISRQVDIARLAFGRTTAERPRQFILFGSTNEDKPLKDQAGNRRTRPVWVTGVDVEKIRRDRDQMFAQALFEVRAGKDLHCDAATEALGATLAHQAKMDPVLLEVLEEYLGGKTNHRIKSYDLSCIVAKSPVRVSGQMLKRAISDAMQDLGWSKSKPIKFRPTLTENATNHGEAGVELARGYMIGKGYRQIDVSIDNDKIRTTDEPFQAIKMA